MGVVLLQHARSIRHSAKFSSPEEEGTGIKVAPHSTSVSFADSRRQQHIDVYHSITGPQWYRAGNTMSNSTADESEDRDISIPGFNESHESQSTTVSSTAESNEDDRRRLSHGAICKLLYTSHFLSTWNSRAFEFGAFLFLATIYPQTLLPASIYALTRAGAAAILSPWLGGYIDHADRLNVVRLSIVGQRVSVAVSCGILFYLCQSADTRADPVWSYSALATLSVLACVEKLAAAMNTIAVERDWVVVIANDDEIFLRSESALPIAIHNIRNIRAESNLAAMNSQMRRIDLFCKLVGPLAISLVDSWSSKMAILVTGTMTVISILIEYFAIARVHSGIPALQESKSANTANRRQHGLARNMQLGFKDAMASTATYVSHRAFLPSFALALLYLTVLSFNGQMITYLVAIGFSSALIGILRGVSAIFELSATWIAPKIMARIGPVRSGIWLLNWQIICVSIACTFFWLTEGTEYQLAASAMTVAAVIASRIGLWGFDLSAQIIVQEEVQPGLRGAFSSQEYAFQNVFEMLSFASTIVFSRPAQFKIPATISAVAVSTAGILYAAFVRSRRGHLVHLSRCMERSGKSGGMRSGAVYQHLPQEEDDEEQSRDENVAPGR